MIEPTDEMLAAFLAEARPSRLWADGDPDWRAGLAAVLAVVARDRCLEAAGHVWHPLARPVTDPCLCGADLGPPWDSTPHQKGGRGCRGARQWPSGRGGSHPHFCVSCSDGETAGPGCINCRQTGFDQTPWPDCPECKP